MAAMNSAPSLKNWRTDTPSERATLGLPGTSRSHGGIAPVPVKGTQRTGTTRLSVGSRIADGIGSMVH